MVWHNAFQFMQFIFRYFHKTDSDAIHRIALIDSVKIRPYNRTMQFQNIGMRRKDGNEIVFVEPQRFFCADEDAGFGYVFRLALNGVVFRVYLYRPFYGGTFIFPFFVIVQNNDSFFDKIFIFSFMPYVKA